MASKSWWGGKSVALASLCLRGSLATSCVMGCKEMLSTSHSQDAGAIFHLLKLRCIVTCPAPLCATKKLAIDIMAWRAVRPAVAQARPVLSFNYMYWCCTVVLT